LLNNLTKWFDRERYMNSNTHTMKIEACLKNYLATQ
jgi:hypothetical protein